MTNGFTTTILHSDLESPIEHYSVHKPMHAAVAFGYPDARDLAKVFKGELPGYAYGRQGNPTTAALEVKISKMEDGIATACFSGNYVTGDITKEYLDGVEAQRRDGAKMAEAAAASAQLDLGLELVE